MQFEFTVTVIDAVIHVGRKTEGNFTLYYYLILRKKRRKFDLPEITLSSRRENFHSSRRIKWNGLKKEEEWLSQATAQYLYTSHGPIRHGRPIWEWRKKKKRIESPFCPKYRTLNLEGIGRLWREYTHIIKNKTEDRNRSRCFVYCFDFYLFIFSPGCWIVFAFVPICFDTPLGRLVELSFLGDYF